jgi:DNA polymerase-3 subunit alpha
MLKMLRPVHRTIIFDTETTGLPKDKTIPPQYKKDNWPDLVSICWRVYDHDVCVANNYYVIKPDGWKIPAESSQIHGITDADANKHGIPLSDVMTRFLADRSTSHRVIAHNISFDKQVIFHAMFWRLGMYGCSWDSLSEICTGLLATEELQLPFRSGRGFKMPSLKELYVATFGQDEPAGAHNAERDVDVVEKVIRKRWPILLSP